MFIFNLFSTELEVLIAHCYLQRRYTSLFDKYEHFRAEKALEDKKKVLMSEVRQIT